MYLREVRGMTPPRPPTPVGGEAVSEPSPPTECEACFWIRGSGLCTSFNCRDHTDDLHARIRELVATVQSAIRIYRQVESERRPNGKGLSPFFFGQRLRRLIREWVELSEAALARSEGGGA
jgi:hypothetical protein